VALSKALDKLPLLVKKKRKQSLLNLNLKSPRQHLMLLHLKIVAKQESLAEWQENSSSLRCSLL